MGYVLAGIPPTLSFLRDFLYSPTFTRILKVRHFDPFGKGDRNN